MNETKYWYQSTEIWINIVAFAAAVVGLLLEQSWLPPQVAGFLVIVASFLNFILRLKNKPRKDIEPTIVPRRCRKCKSLRCTCQSDGTDEYINAME